MQKIKKLYLILLCSLGGAALLFTLGAVLFLVNTLYVFAVIFAVISGALYYAAFFIGFALWDVITAIKLVSIIEKQDTEELSVISENMNWKESATERFIARCKKKGYINK